jgi:DNA repair protein RadC
VPGRWPFEAPPHYHGHRERLRDRFEQPVAMPVSDYRTHWSSYFSAPSATRRQPLAKTISKFGSFPEVIGRAPGRLARKRASATLHITELRVCTAAASRMARGQVQKRPVLSSWSSVIDYCRTVMAFAEKEQFRVLFLDKRNQLIADELQQSALSITRQSIRARWSSARLSSPRLH